MNNFISRRDLLKASAFGAVGATIAKPLEAIAGPFSMQDYRYLVPRDKKLDPAWVRSLTERGEEPWLSGDNLKYIGMPIGGFFAGTVYLGGDGTLWNWDIFNQHHEGGVARPGGVEYGGEFAFRENGKLRERDGANYVDPPEQQSPFYSRSAFMFYDQIGTLSDKWLDVEFLGQYPVGTVKYSHKNVPAEITLEAFSPFCPLDVEKSSYPAVILRYSVENITDVRQRYMLSQTFVNPCCLYSKERLPALELTARQIDERLSGCEFGVKEATVDNPRPIVQFEDFESGSYSGWTVEGTAFGDSPQRVSELADYQGDVGARGSWVVNSHNVRQGEDVREGDQHTGRLLSPPFEIQRKYVNFRIGGGNHPGKTCINLLIEGETVRTATGHNSNIMRSDGFDVADFSGKTARLEIVDQETGGWGNIGIDEIVFSDEPAMEGDLEDLSDYGTFCFGVIGDGHVTLPQFEEGIGLPSGEKYKGWNPNASVEKLFYVEPGETQTVTFIVAWHFPNLQIPGLQGQKRWYASKWDSAYEVAKEVAENIDELTETTFKWRDTWYDSTLPYWFLDRTFVNTSILATNTCYRFDDGRYWFWEGIGCCPGTCSHVWGYAQAAARVFPEIETYLREKIDFGDYFHTDTGAIDYRAEFGRSVAIDGQCGCIMRAYREHTMQKDNAFLKGVWPNVKKAAQYVINNDPDRNGMLEGAQYNTLDTAWYGPMSWISSMYLGALRAAEAMATEMGDDQFAHECNGIIETGSKNIVSELFDGEYFIHKPDPAHPEANATSIGCHIDQLYGQSWCHWMGLERIIPAEESKKALSNLYKYNFTPDVGPYRRGMKAVKGGRWYAVPGEGGLLMTTFPKGGAERGAGQGRDEWAAMYFNECMTGFEYQAAAHMVAEDLVTEGLAVTRAIHDRYSPSKRNPYNEIECSDHYGRAMASYGVYWNLCGFNIHGPKNHLSIDPKLSGDFRCAFVAPDGWGTISRDGTKEYRHKI